MMLFIIDCAKGNPPDPNPPCDEASVKIVACYDVRVCSEEEYDNKIRQRSFGGYSYPWREFGKEHQVLPCGYIKRRVDDGEKFVIKIPTLKAPMEFCAKYGEVVIRPATMESNYNIPRITIYDDHNGE